MTSSHSNPACIIKVIEAIKTHSRYARRGVSRVRIYQEIGKNYPGTLLAAARRAIQKALSEDILIHGETNARFKLTEKGKEFAAEKLKKSTSKNVVTAASKSAPVVEKIKKVKKSKRLKKSTANKKKSAKKSAIKKKTTKKKFTATKKKSIKKKVKKTKKRRSVKRRKK